MANPSTVKKIIDSWILRSDVEIEEFNKFIALWISFNAYYVSQTGESADYKALKKMKANPDILAFYDIIKDGTEICTLEGLCPIQNMKNGIMVSFNKESLDSCVTILYQIRNNLFHGSKAEHVDRDKELVKAATPVLRRIVTFCQDNFLNLDF